MTPQKLHQLFASGPQPMAMPPGGIPAAVLLPVFFAGPELMVLFIQRTEQVKTHRGQISFPGGKRDGIDPNPLATALREAQEEIGLPPAKVRVLGYLGRLTTVTGFQIDGFAGLVPFPDFLQPNPPGSCPSLCLSGAPVEPTSTLAAWAPHLAGAPAGPGVLLPFSRGPHLGSHRPPAGGIPQTPGDRFRSADDSADYLLMIKPAAELVCFFPGLPAAGARCRRCRRHRRLQNRPRRHPPPPAAGRRYC